MWGSVVAVVLVVAGGGFALAYLLPTRAHMPAGTTPTPLPSASLTSADGTRSVAATASYGTTASPAIEVPDVVGKPVQVAEALVTAAGLTVQTRVADPPSADATPDAVIGQQPEAGALVPGGSVVVITYQPRGSVDASGSPYVVVIDAGHQLKADLALEPIGPGSKVKKAKVAGGATGVATHEPEYERALEVALRLRDDLVGDGVRVVMVRTTNDVDIPNSRRAIIGNDARADVVVRVHFDSSADSAVNGVSALYPTGTSWTLPIEPASHTAAAMVEDSLVAATGAFSRGVFGRSDMSGFNYSTRPTIIVECGFMSNPVEDRRDGDPAFQQRIAAGIATGVMGFLHSR